MSNRTSQFLLALIALALWCIALRPLAPLDARPARAAAQTVKDNEELARMYREDQADRTPKDGKEIDWEIVSQRDKAREARAKELYFGNQLKTGADYYHMAMILQHAGAPEDQLLAHELCVAAISKGEERAKWLAAASEDRFLMNIGRPQRFGTQYRKDGDGPFKLYTVDTAVTDELRRVMGAPTLTEAKAREERFNKK